MAQALGIIRVFFGGNELAIKPGGSFRLGGIVSRPQVAGTEVYRSEAMMESEITVQVILERGQRLTDLIPANVERELQVHCDTGQTFVFEAAFRKETLTITAGDASQVEVVFAAGAATEITAA